LGETGLLAHQEKVVPTKLASLEKVAPLKSAFPEKVENVTQIVLGRSRASLAPRILRRSVTGEIVRRSHDIAIHVVIDDAEQPSPAPRKLESAARQGWPCCAAQIVALHCLSLRQD